MHKSTANAATTSATAGAAVAMRVAAGLLQQPRLAVSSALQWIASHPLVKWKLCSNKNVAST